MVATSSLDWLQTLADGTRVRLLRLLKDEELSVSELCSVLQLPQSTVSRHLKVLAADDWIANRRDGTNQLYRVDAEAWCEARYGLWNWVRDQADSPTTSLDQQRLRQVLSQRLRSEAFFSSSADHWDQMRVELFGHRLDSLVFAAALPPDAIVGELGCGSAPICQQIAPFVKEAIAVDNSSAMLATARQQLSDRSNVRLVRSNLNELALEDDSLDLAWLVLVLPYLDQPVDALLEAQRVLKPGAPLVIVDLLPHDRTTYRQEMGHLRLGVEQTELDHWLAQAGMSTVRHTELPPDPIAKGPALFAAMATRTAGNNGNHT